MVALLLAAVGAGYGLAILTDAIEMPRTLWSDASPAAVNSPSETSAGPVASTTQPRASSAPAPTATRVSPTPITIPTAIPTATPLPTYTPIPVPTPRPTPTPTPTPIPTPTPVPVTTAALPWVADGIDESERPAFRELSTLIKQNPNVAKIILDRPWVADGVNGPEKAAIERISDIGNDLPTFAKQVTELPWLADDVTQPESEVVEILWEISDLDLTLGGQFISLSWLGNGITQTEASLLSYLRFISRNDIALTEDLVALPWLTDDVTQTEAALLSDLRFIARLDVALAKRLVALPWLVDDLDESEQTIIDRLYWIARDDTELAKSIANKTWLSESLTDDAARSVNSLYYIKNEDTALARNIANMPFLETLEPTDAAALEALAWLAYSEILALREVLSHPTLKDGITDDWAPVVALMDSVNEAAPAFLRPLLDPEQATVERRSISLAYTGTADLAIIRTTPGAPCSINLLEHSVGSIENFMGTALPTNYVGLLFGTAVLGYSHGTHYGDYFVMLPQYDVDDGSDDADYAGHLMAHEVAHFYWRGNPNWLDEGLAELLAAISENQRTGTPVAIDYTYCSASDNIALLERLDAAGVIYDYRCNYALGGQFFLDLYNALGDAAFRQGLHSLYQASLVEDYADEFDGSPVGIRQIQDAFQTHSAAVAPIIDQWYHGTSQ